MAGIARNRSTGARNTTTCSAVECRKFEENLCFCVFDFYSRESNVFEIYCLTATSANVDNSFSVWLDHCVESVFMF